MIVEVARGVQSWLANNMEAYSIDTLARCEVSNPLRRRQ